MRDQRQPTALPRAPDDRGAKVGRHVVPATDVRCQTPGCRRKLAHELHGTLTVECPRCKQTYTLVAA